MTPIGLKPNESYPLLVNRFKGMKIDFFISSIIE